MTQRYHWVMVKAFGPWTLGQDYADGRFAVVGIQGLRRPHKVGPEIEMPTKLRPKAPKAVAKPKPKAKPKAKKAKKAPKRKKAA